MRPQVRRSGVSTLLAVLGLLLVAATAAFMGHDAGLRTSARVRRSRLSTLAALQAQSAIQEMKQAVARDAGLAGTKVHTAIRERLGVHWTRIDLTDALALAPTSIDPSWGRPGAASEGRAGTLVREHRAELTSPRAFPGTEGLDEWTALLTLSAVATVGDVDLSVSRRVVEHFELRVVRIGMPRPFDQVGFLAGDAGAVLDAAAVNRDRRQLLDVADRLLPKVASAPLPSLSPEALERLKAIAAGIPKPGDREAWTPILPEGRSLLVGFDHVEAMRLEELDLARATRERLADLRQKEAALEAARNDPGSIVDRTYELVDATNRGLERIWLFARQTRMHPEGTPAHDSLLPYLERLRLGHFLSRVSLEAGSEHPLVAAWLAGKTRLDGVLDLRSASTPIELTGELKGQVAVLTGRAGVRLRSTNREAGNRGDRLVVIAAGGSVEIAGDVRAQVLVVPEEAEGGESGSVRMAPGTRLAGSLLVPRPGAGKLELGGWILVDPSAGASERPGDAALRPDGGGYVVLVSPEPLWIEEGGEK